MAATRLGTTRPCRITSLAVAATATPLGRKDQGGTAGLLHWAIGRCQIRLLWQPATESVHPPGAPDLLALAERLRQRRLHHRARDRVPAHLEDRPDQALDPEPGVPEAVSHHHHSSFEVSRPGDEKIHFVSLLFAPDPRRNVSRFSRISRVVGRASSRRWSGRAGTAARRPRSPPWPQGAQPGC